MYDNCNLCNECGTEYMACQYTRRSSRPHSSIAQFAAMHASK